jgi:branched-chain amino acid transport system permease protein
MRSPRAAVVDQSRRAVYWTSLTLAVHVVLGTFLLMRSRIGLALMAIRDEPTAAASLGVSVRRAQRLVHVLSSAGAGLAGAIIATNTLRVTPDSNFSVECSAFMIVNVVNVVIGGLGTIEGPVVGAVVLFVLQQQLAQAATWYLLALGVLAVLVVVLAPRGPWPSLSRGRLDLFPVGHLVGAGRSGRI